MRSQRESKRERVTWGDVFPKYRISMLDNGSIKRVRVEGAKKLLLCVEKEVKILLPQEVLHINGSTLTCVKYGGDAVEVSGNIHEITFEEKERTR